MMLSPAAFPGAQPQAYGSAFGATPWALQAQQATMAAQLPGMAPMANPAMAGFPANINLNLPPLPPNVMLGGGNGLIG